MPERAANGLMSATAPAACAGALPGHVAVIMDGNGRWAGARHLPRAAGHREGARTAREVVNACAHRGVRVLTLFAFSSENWQRPAPEVRMLMQLFGRALRDEGKRLVDGNVRLRVIGARDRLPAALREGIERIEAATAGNDGLQLVIAANYGGQWDILQAVRTLAAAAAAGQLDPHQIDASRFTAALSLGELPPPDLLIRTGGEQRISNFLLWHLAYAELWFTPTLWPEFTAEHLDQALAWYASRQRRFGALHAHGGLADAHVRS